MYNGSVPVTFTIKQVPDAVAERLRARASANRRSLQRELLLIVESAVSRDRTFTAVAEPTPVFDAARPATAPARHKATGGSKRRQRKLSLEELWARARTLGASFPNESARIVRRDRDARHRR
jgi:antitoxin FitA